MKLQTNVPKITHTSISEEQQLSLIYIERARDMVEISYPPINLV